LFARSFVEHASYGYVISVYVCKTAIYIAARPV